MANLTNPIEEHNLVSRFSDWVAGHANSQIAWGTNAVPGGVDGNIFGGPTSGKGLEISGANLTSPVSASQIYNVLIGELRRYTRIRKLRVDNYQLGDASSGVSTGSVVGNPTVVFSPGTTVTAINSVVLTVYDSEGSGTLGLTEGVHFTRSNLTTFHFREWYYMDSEGVGTRIWGSSVQIGYSWTQSAPLTFIGSDTQVAFLNSSYDQNVNNLNILSAGTNISASQLETMFSNMRAEWERLRENAITYGATVCHGSCHNSCHDSRGRR